MCVCHMFNKVLTYLLTYLQSGRSGGRVGAERDVRSDVMQLNRSSFIFELEYSKIKKKQ